MGLVPIFCFRDPDDRRENRKCGQGRTLFDLQRSRMIAERIESAARDGRVYFLDRENRTITTMRNEELTELLSPIVANMGLECLGVEYSPSRSNSLVRVYIDAADRAVTVDDCEAVSREVSATLDVHDPVPGRYTLEVSSPGLDRPLYTPGQFSRFVGSQAKLETNLAVDGRRRFQGTILKAGDAGIVIDQDGNAVTIGIDNIGKARLVPDLEQLKLAAKKRKAKPNAKHGKMVRPDRTQEQQA